MKVKVRAIDFKVDQKLVDFVQKKMDKLDQYYDKIIDAVVTLKLDSTSEKENKIADVKINIAGDEFIAKKKAKTFEEAIDLCAESQRRMLRKKNEREKVHVTS